MKERLILLSVLSVLCAGCVTDGSQAIELGHAEFDSARTSLPREYSRYDEASDTLVPTPLDWLLVEDGEPTDDSCAGERGWLWAHGPGDPRIWLFICPADSAAEAESIAADTSLEALFVESLEGIYAAEPVATEPMGLHADRARLACAWGPPNECRGWIYLAQYGAEVVNIQFAVSGHGGVLSQSAFVEFVQSVDAQFDAANHPPTT